MKLLQIGNLKLKNSLILAPMVDVTDLPYRLLCRRAGCALAFTEMLYIDAILHSNKKTEMLMKTSSQDKPIGLQITGNREGEFEKFVKSGKWKKFDLIDLNCGCPSLRITGNSAGSYLLKNPSKIGNMIKILKKTGKPITVKIRLGFKKNNVLEVARAVENAGADALTVHARLAVDGCDVPADWSWISKVKRAVKIPVVGNGDVFSGRDAFEMLKICDGVMIARGAIGAPQIFSRILEHLNSNSTTQKINENFEQFCKVLKEKFETAKHRELSVLGALKNQRFLTSCSFSGCKFCRLNNSNFSNAKSRLVLWGDSAAGLAENERDWRENLKLFFEYLRLERKYYGNEVDLCRVKYLGGKFLRGFKGAGKAREELMEIKKLDEIRKFINSCILDKG